MKANNLSISIPNLGCDKDCKYCISKVTGAIKYNSFLFERNMNKVKEFAKNIGCSSILLTGKGEPMRNFHDILNCLTFFKDFPIELQTNGKILYANFLNDKNILNKLAYNQLNVIAFSIDNIEDLFEYSDLFKYLKSINIIVRVTLIIHKNIAHNSLIEWVILCKQYHIDQLSFRNLTIPNMNCETNQAKETITYIKENSDKKYYNILNKTLTKYYSKNIIRKLNFGATVYDIKGISVTSLDNCLQEKHNDDDIRSLIYMEDGHLYTSWNSKASIIF